MVAIIGFYWLMKNVYLKVKPQYNYKGIKHWGHRGYQFPAEIKISSTTDGGKQWLKPAHRTGLFIKSSLLLNGDGYSLI